MGKAAYVFLASLAIYAAIAGPRLKIHSQDNHFVYLADAFLSGQVELTRTPHHGNDWASYSVLKLTGNSARLHGTEIRGFFTRRTNKPNEFSTLDGRLLSIPPKDRAASSTKYFVSFPPMPAVLMMPAFALVGYGTNDVVFNVLFAAANVLLLFLLLRMIVNRNIARLNDREVLWVLVLFGFGTAHFWCSVIGQVWFTALIVGLGFHLAFIYFAIDIRRPFWAGVCLAAAFSSRATLVFAALFFYWQLFLSPRISLDRKERFRAFCLFSAPCLVVGLALLAYNHTRFESIWNFGHTYLAGGLIPRIRDFGLFHPDFLNRNFAAAFTLTPRLLDAAPYVQFSKHGMSIFLSTPALLWLFKARTDNAIVKASLAAATTIAVPLLLYQNTGWEQFSYRFILDVMPYFILVLVIGRVQISRRLKCAIVIGVVINFVGAVTFHRPPHPKMYGHFLTEEPRR